jgi:hypothetical protein
MITLANPLTKLLGFTAAQRGQDKTMPTYDTVLQLHHPLPNPLSLAGEGWGEGGKDKKELP